MVGSEDFVPFFQPQRVSDNIDAVRTVGYKHEVIGIGSEIRSEGRASFAEQAVDFPSEKQNGLLLQPFLPLPIYVEYFARAGPERAVIEKNNVIAEKEFVFHKYELWG